MSDPFNLSVFRCPIQWTSSLLVDQAPELSLDAVPTANSTDRFGSPSLSFVIDSRNARGLNFRAEMDLTGLVS